MKLPAYPRTKPSGVEWLGDVPAHWDVKRLRRVLAESLQYGASESAELDDPDLPRYVRITDVHENGSLRDDTFRSLPKDVAAPYLLEDGDLLFARSGATSGKTFLYQSSWGICAYAGYLIRARMNQQKAVPAFVKYFTTSTSYWQWLSSVFIQSTIQNVSAEKYDDLHLSLPPTSEQTVIVAFLDRETGRLDRLVAKKRELIERLQEKRTALIARTVTRGLNPTAKLKPSGLEWLGDMPAHWEFKKLRYLCEITTGDKDTVDAVDEGEFPFFVRSQTVERIDSYSFDCEAVLTAGDGVGVGKVFHHHQGKFAVHQRVYVLHNFRKVSGRYLFMFMKEFFARVALGGEAKSTVDSLRRPIFTDFVVSLPPLPEQCAIAEYLDRETAKIDGLVAKVGEAVERLQEYRTALITAAVTGKIDVRRQAERSIKGGNHEN